MAKLQEKYPRWEWKEINTGPAFVRIKEGIRLYEELTRKKVSAAGKQIHFIRAPPHPEWPAFWLYGETQDHINIYLTPKFQPADILHELLAALECTEHEDNESMSNLNYDLGRRQLYYRGVKKHTKPVDHRAEKEEALPPAVKANNGRKHPQVAAKTVDYLRKEGFYPSQIQQIMAELPDETSMANISLGNNCLQASGINLFDRAQILLANASRPNSTFPNLPQAVSDLNNENNFTARDKVIILTLLPRVCTSEWIGLVYNSLLRKVLAVLNSALPGISPAQKRQVLLLIFSSSEVIIREEVELAHIIQNAHAKAGQDIQDFLSQLKEELLVHGLSDVAIVKIDQVSRQELKAEEIPAEIISIGMPEQSQQLISELNQMPLFSQGQKIQVIEHLFTQHEEDLALALEYFIQAVAAIRQMQDLEEGRALAVLLHQAETNLTAKKEEQGSRVKEEPRRRAEPPKTAPPAWRFNFAGKRMSAEEFMQTYPPDSPLKGEMPFILIELRRPHLAKPQEVLGPGQLIGYRKSEAGKIRLLYGGFRGGRARGVQSILVNEIESVIVREPSREPVVEIEVKEAAGKVIPPPGKRRTEAEPPAPTKPRKHKAAPVAPPAKEKIKLDLSAKSLTPEEEAHLRNFSQIIGRQAGLFAYATGIRELEAIIFEQKFPGALYTYLLFLPVYGFTCLVLFLLRFIFPFLPAPPLKIYSQKDIARLDEISTQSGFALVVFDEEVSRVFCRPMQRISERFKYWLWGIRVGHHYAYVVPNSAQKKYLRKRLLDAFWAGRFSRKQIRNLDRILGYVSNGNNHNSNNYRGNIYTFEEFAAKIKNGVCATQNPSDPAPAATPAPKISDGSQRVIPPAMMRSSAKNPSRVTFWDIVVRAPIKEELERFG
ncbi:MAG: hypothetical protein NT033_06620, partial [Candidatus Omnitrophica bacterium]|nr:hypothetical protein [Candidatus Omnitrophota bacterium]